METFFSTSDKIQHIIKSVNLTKTLFVSSIIIGEAHIGKKTLARHLFPLATMVSGENRDDLLRALKEHNEVIITDFEKISNHSELDFSNKRVIAVANYMGNPATIDELFAFIYTMPPLRERTEDIHFLRDKFVTEALKVMILEPDSLLEKNIPINIAQNNKSLKKDIYKYVIKRSMSIYDIEDVIHDYLLKNLEGQDNYREHLGLYERPLIKAGLEKYESQLQLSKALGINRNTLRKKIHENNIN